MIQREALQLIFGPQTEEPRGALRRSVVPPWSVRGSLWLYKLRTLVSEISTSLAFWLRSSVVSVLNSLTTIMGAPPPLLVI